MFLKGVNGPERKKLKIEHLLEVIVLVLDFFLSTLNKLKQYDTVRNIHNSVASGFLFNHTIIIFLDLDQ